MSRHLAALSQQLTGRQHEHVIEEGARRLLGECGAAL
jgi:hypothetical protein